MTDAESLDAETLTAFDKVVAGGDYGSGAMDALKADLHNAGCRGDMLGQIQIQQMMQRAQDAIDRRKKREADEGAA